jgi:hypothetical protein
MRCGPGREYFHLGEPGGKSNDRGSSAFLREWSDAESYARITLHAPSFFTFLKRDLEAGGPSRSTTMRGALNCRCSSQKIERFTENLALEDGVHRAIEHCRSDGIFGSRQK